jgi:hypothetical protein
MRLKRQFILNPVYAAFLLLMACEGESDSTTTAIPQGRDAALEQLHQEVRSAGYDLVYPPTTGYGAGYLFTILETADGTKFRRTICEQTFRGSQLIENDVTLLSKTIGRDNNFEFLIGLSEALLRDLAAAKVALQRSDISAVEVSFSGVKTYEIPPALRPDGTRKLVDPNCEINIATATDSEGQFLQPTFLVVGTLGISAINYDVSRSRSTEGGLQLEIKEIFGVNPQFSLNSTNENRLIVALAEGLQLTVGGHALPISHARILDQVADDLAVEVVVEPSPAISTGVALNLPIERR